MISQFTPYTCVLDCFSFYLREMGFPVFTPDLLANHRDLCHNMPDYHTYGAVRTDLIPELAKRYLLKTVECPVDDFPTISTAINVGHCVLLICRRYGGLDINHCVKIVGIDSNDYKLFTPSFPHGKCETVSPQVIKDDWFGSCLIIKP